MLSEVVNPSAPKEPSDPKSPMTLQRRTQIADMIATAGPLRVSQLAARFDVSEVTIRNDLMQLEKQGQLVRDRGGALPVSRVQQLSSLLAVEQRAPLQSAAKQRIAKAAAGMVSAGDTIFMDAGTTVVEMASHLAEITGLTVVTNALNVALAIAGKTESRVILIGGTLNRESSSAVGPWAEQMLGNLVVQKAFLGTQAFDLENGLTDTTLEIAEIKRVIIRSARRVILLTDSTKLNTSGFIKVAPLTALHTLISDTDLPPDVRAALEQLGVEVVTV
jgi:DeoR/GlpR family transcriptional regulator of sugar metabolism